MPVLYIDQQAIPFEDIYSSSVPQIPKMESPPQLMTDWQKGVSNFSITTSGSTGAPKPFALERERIIYSARLTADTFGLEPGDTLLCCLSLSYIAGMMMVFRALVNDCSLVVTEPIANPLSQVPEGIKLDFASFVPMQMSAILEKNDHHELEVLNGMKAILVGGGQISEALESQLKQFHVPVYHTYSMTETYTHVAIRLLNGAAASAYYYPLKEVTLGVDTRGCLAVSSPVTGWETLITNDLVEFNTEGGFKWLGRIDNVVNSGGIKIQVEETEEQIRKLLSAKGYEKLVFATAGVEDGQLGQKLVLIIAESDEMPAKNELRQWLREELGRYKAPKEIYIVPALRYTHTGKIDRKATVALIP